MVCHTSALSAPAGFASSILSIGVAMTSAMDVQAEDFVLTRCRTDLLDH